MDRKPLGKKAMTAAQRQRRHRRQVAKAKRQAEIVIKRAQNMARSAEPVQWTRIELPANPPLDSPADEIALQIEEALRDSPGTTIDDVRAAIDRRFGA